MVDGVYGYMESVVRLVEEGYNSIPEYAMIPYLHVEGKNVMGSVPTQLIVVNLAVQVSKHS